MPTSEASVFVKRFMSTFKPTVTNEEVEERERKEAEQRKQSAYEKSGVGRRYWNLRLEDYVVNDINRDNYKSVIEYIGDIKKGICRTLWIVGKAGVGKTMLSSLITREVGGVFRRSYELINEARRADGFKSEETKNELIERYVGYKHLVIDEVGKNTGYGEDEEWNILWQILNGRYEDLKPTVIVSNLTKKELAEYLGQRLVDRFTENCKSIEFKGESYRENLRVF